MLKTPRQSSRPPTIVESLEERKLLAFTAADPFLKASGTLIRDTHGTGNIVQLRGTNLGNWLYQEPWMGSTDSSGTITSNTDSENQVWNLLTSRFGATTADSLITTYEQNYITSTDLDNIKALGMNVVRVPFSWRTIENADGSIRTDAFTEMDWLVTNAAQRGIYTIFDLHDLPGPGESSAFWTNTAAMTQVVNLWKTVAQHFAGNSDVAGFDLLNEPQDVPSMQTVWTLYNQIYTSIRSVDPDHMLMMEGTFINWNWDMLPNPATEGWTNVVYEMHEYQYNSPDSTVQAGIDNQVSMAAAHASWNVPGYIGEFNDFNYTDAWNYSTVQYAKAGLSWSEWAYKSAAGDSYGGDIYNSWGIYNDSAHLTAPALSTDSAATILSKWAAFNTASGAFVINPALSSPLALTALDPKIATTASAVVASSPGTAALSVLGSDSVFGESGLSYTWSLTTTTPVGLASPLFSANSTNSAKNTTATFSATGSYTFQVAITDPDGHVVTSSIAYIVSAPAWLAAVSIAGWNPSKQTLTVTGPTSIIADPIADNPLIQANGSSATITFNATSALSVHLNGLSLTNGASATLASLGSARTSTNHQVLIISTAGLTVDSLSRLDLTDNDLIIRQGNLRSTTTLLANGYTNTSGKDWTGYGITSSKAGLSPLTTLGIEQIFTSQTFDNQSVTPGDLLIKYTIYGNANLSNAVDGSDYSLIDYGFLAHQTGWQNGDFNYDGVINGSDYTLIDNAFNTQSAVPLASIAIAPRPAPPHVLPSTVSWSPQKKETSKPQSIWISSGLDS